MIKRLLGINRYYIVFYTFSVNGKNWGAGHIGIKNTLGNFFNNNFVIDEVTKDMQNRESIDVVEISKTDNINVTITGWQELSRSDFNNFTNKNEV